MNILTEGRKALIARLETITQANGYRTNAGHNVRTGWFNEVLESKRVGFPLIVLQKAKAGSEPEEGPGVIRLFPSFHIIGAVDEGLDEYDDALDDIELDIIRCLITPKGAPIVWMPRGTTAVSLSPPEQFPPGNGERAASVVVPVQLAINIRP